MLYPLIKLKKHKPDHHHRRKLISAAQPNLVLTQQSTKAIIIIRMRLIGAVLLLAELLHVAQSQAPSDFNGFCSNSRFQSQLDEIPKNAFPLIDSYRYTTLLSGSQARWATVDLDGNGQTWREAGGLCQLNLILNSCREDIGTPRNLLFTQYISYEDSSEITFDFNYRFNAACPNCDITPVSVYRFDTTGIRSPDVSLDITNYDINMGALEQEGTTDNSLSMTILRPSNSNIKGFYLAFEDNGTCGQLGRVVVHHRISPGFRDDSNLVTCPTIPLSPIGSDKVTSAICTCDAKTVPTTGLERTCDSTGKCTTDIACACIPGYELSSDGRCTICPPGTFKATASNRERCTPCPLNSQALFAGNEVCECDCGTVRPRDQPGAQCQSPPSSPMLANNNPPLVNDKGLTVSWLPATDGGSSETLHYNVFLFNPSTQTYIRHNNNGVVQNQGEDLIHYTIDGIGNLDSASVVVTAASAATGDFDELENLNLVQNRFVVFYVTLKTIPEIVVIPPKDNIVPEEIIAPEIPPEKIKIPDEIINPGILPEQPTTESESTTQETTQEETTTQETTQEVATTQETTQEVATTQETTQEVATTQVAPTEMPKLFFTLGDMVLNNESSVSLDSIGEDGDALLCHTDDKEGCCRAALVGEFYYPSEVPVPVRSAGQSVFRNRGAGFIRLNNTGRSGTPLGRYRCEIPDSTGELQNIFITITPSLASQS